MGLGHSQKRYVLVMAVTMCIDDKAVVMPFSSPLKAQSSEKVADSKRVALMTLTMKWAVMVLKSLIGRHVSLDLQMPMDQMSRKVCCSPECRESPGPRLHRLLADVSFMVNDVADAIPVPVRGTIVLT
eukprot:3544725-Amphidinium_carterae.1